MATSKNDGLNKQPTYNAIPKEINRYEDEINLIDYFRVLWKWKYFIVLGSILPALIFGLFFFFSPRSYKVTYVYDVRDDVRDDVSNWNLNEKNYNILINRFYSEENLNKIINKLQENGLVTGVRHLLLTAPAKMVFDAFSTLIPTRSPPPYLRLKS